MSGLYQLDHQLLNAVADDFESLEQIYRSLCLEFSAENYNPADSRSFYWREAPNAPSLAEIVECIKRLVTGRLLEARTETGLVVSTVDDSSILWNGWFYITDLGRQSMIV